MADAPGYPGLEVPLDRRPSLLRSGTDSTARPWPERLRRLLPVLVIAAVAAWAGWAWASGWRVLVITTPFMSPAVPVGAAVFTHPGVAHRGAVIASPR